MASNSKRLVINGSWIGNSGFTTQINSKFRLISIILGCDEIPENCRIFCLSKFGANYDTTIAVFADFSYQANFDLNFEKGDEILICGNAREICHVVIEIELDEAQEIAQSSNVD